MASCQRRKRLRIAIALDSVVVRVRALSLSPVVSATQVCVITLRRTLEARTNTLGESGHRAVAAACHGLTPLQC